MVKAVPRITARVTFLHASEGGRSMPAVASEKYRPHLVVGDPERRQAIVAADGHTLTEEYLGVCLPPLDRVLSPGRPYELALSLIYAPEVNYAALTTGATFTVREGGTVVGHGEVLKGVDSAAL